jgi:glycosyltransferase involved in cell wall biosynthesis
MSLLHNSFRDIGVDSFLLCLNQGEPQSQPHDIPGVITLDRGWGEGILGTLKNLVAFRKVLKSLNANIIVGNCELPELYLSLINLKNYKVFCVEHTTYPWFGRRAVGYVVRNILTIKKVSWITVSSEEGKIWPRSENPQYIPNPIAKPSEVQKENNEVRLAFIGRLRPEKRPEWALQVSKVSGIPIDFYGTGPLEDELSEYAKSHEIQAFFHGYRSDVWNQISKNTIVITPSEFEGDGLTVVEAIVRGLPILLADNIDLRRFRLNPQSYSTSSLKMAEKVMEISSKRLDELRPSQFLIEKYRTNRSVETIANKWKKVFELN